MPSIAVKGVEISYDILGEGEPVLLIGGLELDRTRRQVIAKELSKYYTVLTYDGNGGKSIDAMADDMAGFMDALGLRKVNLVGGSIGALIAQAMAVKYPERVNGIVLFSTPMHMTIKGWLMMSMVGLPGENPDKGMPDFSVRRQLSAVRKFDVKKAMKSIRAPTLIIHGNKDGLVPIRQAEELTVGIGGARLVVLEGGHRFYMDNLDAFIRAINGFFAMEEAATA